MEAKTLNYFSPKSKVSASRLEKSSLNNPCYSNYKHPSKSVVLDPSSRRHPRTIFRLDKTVRIRRISGRYKLFIPGRLRRPRQTIHRDNLPHACLQNQKSLEFFHAQRQPRVLQHQPHLWILWRVYISLHKGKRKYNIKLWKTFSDVFNVMPVCALID